jgi:hypothetical protein
VAAGHPREAAGHPWALQLGAKAEKQFLRSKAKL